MNFQNLPPVETSKQLLDLAFHKAKEKGKLKDLKGNWLEIIRKKNCLKYDIVKDTLVLRLEKLLADFPKEPDLSPFYRQLMGLTLDFSRFKKALSSLAWAVERINAFQKDYVRKTIKTKEAEKIKQLAQEFYGRVSSVINQISKDLDHLEKCREIMRTYPCIKELFTVCIYGFPNVGKTTLLNKITGTKAEVAAYAFTTKSINAGYFEVEEKKIQVLDVPGTLARPEKMNNIERQAELVMQEVANLIIYVFDLSESSGYSLKWQVLLFEKISQNKKVLVYLSKRDLLEEKRVNNFLKRHPEIKALGIEQLKEEIIKSVPASPS